MGYIGLYLLSFLSSFYFMHGRNPFHLKLVILVIFLEKIKEIYLRTNNKERNVKDK